MPTAFAAGAVLKAPLRNSATSISGSASRRWRANEGAQQRDPGRDGGSRQPLDAVLRGLLDPVHGREDPGGAQQGAEGVNARGGGVADLGHDPRADDEQERHHRHVRHEDRAPARQLQQRASEQRPERGAEREAPIIDAG